MSPPLISSLEQDQEWDYYRYDKMFYLYKNHPSHTRVESVRKHMEADCLKSNYHATHCKSMAYPSEEAIKTYQIGVKVTLTLF